MQSRNAIYVTWPLLRGDLGLISRRVHVDEIVLRIDPSGGTNRARRLRIHLRITWI
jgi:hypothetical protein